MEKPKLVYFDAAASRGEECRLAFHCAGVPFEDVRIKREEWPALKPTTPFGSLPVLHVAGKPPLAQSNAILAFVGRQHGLHPQDPFEAARHEAMMGFVEDLRGQVAPTLRISDAEERRKAREAIATGYLPTWGEKAQAQIGDGPFFAGSKLHVVDLKLFIIVRWFVSGILDHIPATVFAPYPKLARVHDAVRDDERVKAWYAKK
jgi:glutathione S-transferase